MQTVWALCALSLFATLAHAVSLHAFGSEYGSSLDRLISQRQYKAAGAIEGNLRQFADVQRILSLDISAERAAQMCRQNQDIADQCAELELVRSAKMETQCQVQELASEFDIELDSAPTLQQLVQAAGAPISPALLESVSPLIHSASAFSSKVTPSCMLSSGRGSAKPAPVGTSKKHIGKAFRRRFGRIATRFAQALPQTQETVQQVQKMSRMISKIKANPEYYNERVASPDTTLESLVQELSAESDAVVLWRRGLAHSTTGLAETIAHQVAQLFKDVLKTAELVALKGVHLIVLVLGTALSIVTYPIRMVLNALLSAMLTGMLCFVLLQIVMEVYNK